MKERGKKRFKKTWRFFKWLYLKLFRINDTPQKIAVGFGLGVFLGVMPGTGPIAALFFALLFKVNRASALLASILTNTWLSIPIFLLSVKTGSVITSSSYSEIYKGWSVFLKDFHWVKLFQLSAYKILMPIIIGYAVVSFCIGTLAYVIILAALKYMKKRKE